MANSPLSEAKDIVSFKIRSDGSEIKDTYLVHRISVDHALNRIPAASIELIDGNVATQDFEVSNSNDFVPGKEIEIMAGYEGDEKTIFKGIVTSMKMSFDSIHGSILDITCRDKAILMAQARKNAYYSNVKDSDIFSTLIGKYNGLKPDIDTTSVEHKELVQYDATDWDFMMIRAGANGFFASVNQGKVSVKKPNVSSASVLSLTYGVDLLEFEAELNAAGQSPAVDAFSWDSTSQKIVTSSGSEPSVPAIGNINGKKLGNALGIDNEMLISSAQLDSASLKSWANAKLLKARLACLTGSAKFIGSSSVIPNSNVELNGVGERFSGKAYVSAVKHLIEEGSWTTEIRFGIDKEWIASKPNVISMPASGLSPQIGGLMIGKVKQLDRDPINENRILVMLPMMQDDGSAIWARMATFYATNKKGNFFIPEIDDEVVIGFLNNDPNYPIILGALYSSKIPPPYEITQDNFTKAIVTKSDCKIEFDDDKKVITLQTPGKNEIIISDDTKGITAKDQNNNTITTNSEGIRIMDSHKNEIVMSAGGIEINSSSNIKLSTSVGDITFSGLNITSAAKLAMKSSGQASAEFSAEGQTTIKGAMVMIN